MTDFPIMSKHLRSIPWAMIAPHEPQALRNHRQTLRRLAERGGLCPSEALHILRDEPWGGPTFCMPAERDARDAHDRERAAELAEMVKEWEAGNTVAVPPVLKIHTS